MPSIRVRNATLICSDSLAVRSSSATCCSASERCLATAPPPPDAHRAVSLYRRRPSRLQRNGQRSGAPRRRRRASSGSPDAVQRAAGAGRGTRRGRATASGTGSRAQTSLPSACWRTPQAVLMASRMISPRPAATLPEGPYCMPAWRGSAWSSRPARQGVEVGQQVAALRPEPRGARVGVGDHDLGDRVSHAHGHHDRRTGMHHRVGQHLAHRELRILHERGQLPPPQGRPDEQPGGRDRGRVVGEVLLRNPTHVGSSPGLGHVLPRTEGLQPMVSNPGTRDAGRRASPHRSR